MPESNKHPLYDQFYAHYKAHQKRGENQKEIQESLTALGYPNDIVQTAWATNWNPAFIEEAIGDHHP